jgi:hypothetical protein
MNETDQQAAQESARAAFLETLSQGRTHARVLTAIEIVSERLDQEIALNAVGRPKPACQPGCSHCCHLVVHCSLAEVLRAAEYVDKNFSAEERKALEGRLYAYERAVAPSFARNLGRLRTPCPLLQSGLCSIYPARPLRCRGVNSLDASPCERQKNHPEEEVTPPRVFGQLEMARGAISGVIEGLARFGPNVGTLDFGRALSIALSQPGAIDDEFKLKNPFNPAQALPNISAKPKMVLGDAFYPVYGDGDEPVGRCQPADLEEHARLFVEGDTLGAVNVLTGTHPVNLMRRIVAPMLYRNEDEVDFWRDHFSQAVRALGEAKFDPREAYDALQVLATFELAYQQHNDRDILTQLGQTVVSRITSQALPELCRPVAPRKRDGKLRVGYISENLTYSNGGSWALGWLRNHAPDVETTCICLSDRPDFRTQQFKAHSRQFLHYRDANPANARRIKELDLDVLIFTDLGMSGRNIQYAGLRLAPIQCTAWGHPVTSGLPTIDYYLSSELMEPPDGDDHYSEKLVRLPGSGLCYDRSSNPVSRMVRSDFGLDDGPLYLSCQNPMKYLPRWDLIYREIGERTGRPIVFVEGPMPMDKSVLKQRMAEAGVRAIWIPALGPSDFKALIGLADVCLDTPGWNGGNTTIEALTLRTPIVTLPGEFMRGRHSLAFCGIADTPGSVAINADDYIRKACEPDQLREAAHRTNPDALYEDKSPVAALEAFFREVLGF